MDIRFKLVGGASPRGQIGALELSRISRALHDLSIRVGREQVSATGPGRSTRTVEDLSQVRVVSLDVGSTVIDVATGPPDMLPLDFQDTRWRDDQLNLLLVGMATDQRPEGVAHLVADSVGELVEGLRAAAPVVEMTLPGDAPRRFATGSLHRDIWSSASRSVGGDVVGLVGLLEKVDIHSHGLRLRDDVGNTIELSEVADDVAAAQLVGASVTATGHAVRNRDGRVVGVHAPLLVAYDTELPVGLPLDTERASYDRPGPDPDGGVELTDEEFDEFLHALGR